MRRVYAVRRPVQGLFAGFFVPQRRTARKPADALFCDGGKGIAATFGCFLGLLPHWIPLCVLASIFIFFSCVVKINPNYYRTVATYILAAICTVWLEPNRYIVFGFLLIAASVLAKLFMSAEEKEHFEVKLAWKH